MRGCHSHYICAISVICHLFSCVYHSLTPTYLPSMCGSASNPSWQSAAFLLREHLFFPVKPHDYIGVHSEGRDFINQNMNHHSAWLRFHLKFLLQYKITYWYFMGEQMYTVQKNITPTQVILTQSDTSLFSWPHHQTLTHIGSFNWRVGMPWGLLLETTDYKILLNISNTNKVALNRISMLLQALLVLIKRIKLRKQSAYK